MVTTKLSIAAAVPKNLEILINCGRIHVVYTGYIGLGVVGYSGHEGLTNKKFNCWVGLSGPTHVTMSRKSFNCCDSRTNLD
ncbi:hypothetical protein Ahy_B03g065829 isoform A [Arachis hypogaea]|uniref:Uncharacterized protein n=1 Tax=Arachis hypogaea TaxID=3818 RepID=A0A445A2G6_ARAHY|nr:hypothetical protein Ahy_B03g065829 isoform A [Arachis hypogaea]